MVDPSHIAELAIYPPLGIARVGNAEGDDYVLAPETIGASVHTGMRDGQGRIKRQAVLFRVYAKLKSGEVRELTLDDGIEIEWRVAVANLKAGWYEFTNALDLPDGLPIPAKLRNADVASGRHRLDIVPPARTIAGRNQAGADKTFEGKFFQASVYLGEVRTDGLGRLLFLGGRGRSAPRWPGSKPTTFANNPLWHDDVSDGSVRARVTVGGKVIDATPACVAVAPPNYAPGVFGVVTMDDVVRETFQSQGWLPSPAETSFTHDIWPIFSRLAGLQWVNHGLFMAHGFGSTIDAENPDVLAKMTDASEAQRKWRKTVLCLFRDPSVGGKVDRFKLPYIYGDAFGDADDHAKGLLPVTPTMYRHLSAWADGGFVSDWQGVPQPPKFGDLSPVEQLEHLSRAPLYECLGGPFHPGIELTWIMRIPSLWAAPYRLKVLDEVEPAKQDFGPTLTAEICLSEDGPLQGVAPGALTRWLGVPWQTDEASCLSDFEYSPSTYLSMPSYWGARVPNQVLSAEAWSRATDGVSPAMQRVKHMSYREDWTRDINGRDYYERIATMVDEWWMLGMLAPQNTPQHLRDLGIPERVFVEGKRHPSNAGSNEKLKLVRAIERLECPIVDLTAGAVPGGAPPGQPPRRVFHRGEV